MRSKYYSQYLLRALDGEDLPLDEELKAMVRLADRVRAAAPAVAPLDGEACRRIWESATGRETEALAPQRRRSKSPRAAWGLATAAALAAMVVLALALVFTGGGPVPEPSPFARLRISQGEIAVVGRDGAERPAEDGAELSGGDTVICRSGSRGVVEFESGSFMRLDGDSRAVLYSRDGGVEVEVASGRTYHRVLGGKTYAVVSGGVKASAEGTAFTFEVGGGSRRVADLQATVKVEVNTESLAGFGCRLEEGDLFIYEEGAREAGISDLTRHDLDDEWLRWNKALDEELGLPVGVLSMLDEEESGQPGQPQQEPGQTQQEAEIVPPSPPPPERSVNLSAQASQGMVEFTWTVVGYEGFQGYKLCRSKTNPSPSHPGDWWKYIDGESTRNAVDDSAEPGSTYYYRLAVYHQGVVLGYSNSVQVAVPRQPSQLSINLSGEVSGGKVVLSWTVGGQGSYTGFKVCRSETNSAPAYPGDTCTFVDYSQHGFVDTGVESAHTYYYRVGIYLDGAVVQYSNALRLTVP